MQAHGWRYTGTVGAGGTDSRAHHDFELVVSKLGALAFNFLLTRSAQALEAIEEAMAYRPNWVGLQLIMPMRSWGPRHPRSHCAS